MLPDCSHQRITPLLPSMKDVIDHPDCFLIDHIQFVTRVNDFNIGTGNLTGQSAFSGCHQIMLKMHWDLYRRSKCNLFKNG